MVKGHLVHGKTGKLFSDKNNYISFNFNVTLKERFLLLFDPILIKT